MTKEFIVVIVFYLAQASQALVQCNAGNVTKLQLCTLDQAYDKSIPDPTERPMKIISSVTVFSISDLNQFENTISLNLLLSVVWNDTRLTMESNDPKKYI